MDGVTSASWPKTVHLGDAYVLQYPANTRARRTVRCDKTFAWSRSTHYVLAILSVEENTPAPRAYVLTGKVLSGNMIFLMV